MGSEKSMCRIQQIVMFHHHHHRSLSGCCCCVGLYSEWYAMYSQHKCYVLYAMRNKPCPVYLCVTQNYNKCLERSETIRFRLGIVNGVDHYVKYRNDMSRFFAERNGENCNVNNDK